MPDRRSAPPRAWQRMLSGRRLDLLDPSPLDIEIDDIAHGLARVARWNGQTYGDNAFSVAQHSILVEHIVGILKPETSQKMRLATLLHDGPEYVIGDMISPFKRVMGGDYTTIEDRLQAAIHLRFQLPARLSAADKKLIKRADMVAAFFEATRLAGFSEDEARTFFGKPDGVDEVTLPLTPWPAAQAQAAFITRFNTLFAEVSL